VSWDASGAPKVVKLLGRCRRTHGLSEFVTRASWRPSTELDDMDLDDPFDLLKLFQVGGLPFRARPKRLGFDAIHSALSPSGGGAPEQDE
jgi:hypothetical protein